MQYSNTTHIIYTYIQTFPFPSNSHYHSHFTYPHTTSTPRPFPSPHLPTTYYLPTYPSNKDPKSYAVLYCYICVDTYYLFTG